MSRQAHALRAASPPHWRPAGTAPAFAADYVQAPGSSLAFAGKLPGRSVHRHASRASHHAVASIRSSWRIAQLDVDDPARQRHHRQRGPRRECAATRSSTAASSRRRATPRPSSARSAATGTPPTARCSLHGVSKPVTLTFTWTPGAQPVLAGKATVKRLDFGVGGGDWADTGTDAERDRDQHEGRAAAGEIARPAASDVSRDSRACVARIRSRLATLPTTAASAAPSRIERPVQFDVRARRRATPARASRSALPARRRHR